MSGSKSACRLGATDYLVAVHGATEPSPMLFNNNSASHADWERIRLDRRASDMMDNMQKEQKLE